MISVTQLRSGVTFEDKGDPWRVLEYKHTHISRGSGTIKVKCKNLKTGNVLNKTFKSGEKVEEISVSKNKLQYLYQEEDEYLFMDPVSFEQVSLSVKVVKEEAVYLREGEEVSVFYWDEMPLTLDLPPKMVFKVKEAAPGEKGDSASNVYKEAVLENGLKVKVPLFVSAGEKVRVDTRTGEYIERAT